MSANENLDDLARGVEALAAALRGLTRIAAMEDGVLSDWAMQSINEVTGIMVPECRLRAMDIPVTAEQRLEAAWDTRR